MSHKVKSSSGRSLIATKSKTTAKQSEQDNYVVEFRRSAEAEKRYVLAVLAVLVEIVVVVVAGSSTSEGALRV